MHAFRVLAISLCLLLPALPATAASLDATPLPQVTPVHLTAQEIDTVTRAVRNRMKDPDSAKFSKIIAGQQVGGLLLVCGLVNAKNSFGGYTGAKPFMVQLVPGDSFRTEQILKLQDQLEGLRSYAETAKYCADQGLPL